MKNAFKFQIIIFLLLFVYTGLTTKIFGQISIIQDLSFGEFYPSTSSGLIEITTSGGLISSGVVHLGGSISSAQFTIRTTGKQRPISFTFVNPVVQLDRVGGGGQMTLAIGPVSPPSYTHPGGNFSQNVRVGGRLTVGSITTNPPGDYIGEFSITINNF
jgi:hypothetical protein